VLTAENVTETSQNGVMKKGPTLWKCRKVEVVESNL